MILLFNLDRIRIGKNILFKIPYFISNQQSGFIPIASQRFENEIKKLCASIVQTRPQI